jgi:hypothetical protein
MTTEELTLPYVDTSVPVAFATVAREAEAVRRGKGEWHGPWHRACAPVISREHVTH